MPDAFRLAIVGSRSLVDKQSGIYHPDLVPTIQGVLNAYSPTLVVSGGAIGVDTCAVEEAVAWGIPILVKKPQPKGQGRKAYIEACFARNQEIVDAADVVVAIMADGGTNGSRDTIRRAEKAEKPTQVIFLDA